MQDNTKTEKEKIKELVQTIEDMHLQEPYKTATFNAMLARLLGNVTPVAQEIGQKAEKSKEKKVVSTKTGRGNKLDFVVKMEELLDTDFFNVSRTMREIQTKLREHGYSIDLPKLSPRLLFFVRSGQLKRTKNAKKRFAYFKENHNPSGHSSGLDTDLNRKSSYG